MTQLHKSLRRAAWLLAAWLLPYADGWAAEGYLPGSPEWTADLVIYEIAPKGFTSPQGPESGTFASLEAKLAYLQDLGINGIWLTGHSLADPHHFYNIWTQYAVIEPDRIDPSLGTPAQFKQLIDAAHRHGIKVFLDVIDHGVMAQSSLLQTHPQWFRGGSWGMVDFDYFGGHTDFDDWWVNTWTGYVTRFGVDGFRLDTNTPRPDLWARIRANAVAAGHPIVIWEEHNGTIPGVSDFSQQDNRLLHIHGTPSGLGKFNPEISTTALDSLLTNNLPGYLQHQFGKAGIYTVEIRYTDGTIARGDSQGQGPLAVKFNGLTADKASRRYDEHSPLPDGVRDVQLTLEGVGDKPIQAVSISNDNDMHWTTDGETAGFIAVEREGSVVRLYLATHTQGSALMLSCHDNGWQGFPENQNPFVAQGSRALFGYSFLLTPMLPIFMSGEEFAADFHPLPNLSPNLFGAQNPGHGRWLYGAMLDWTELQQPRHKQMYADVKQMLAIRKRYSAVLHAVRGDIEPSLLAVPYSSNIDVPKPYIRWQGDRAIVVCANRNETAAADLKLTVPLDKLGWTGHKRFRVTDLWNERPPRTYSVGRLSNLSLQIKPDKSPRGGLAVLSVEPLE